MSTSFGKWIADRLRVEYETEPVGLGVVRPRFSWVLQSEASGRMQSAYRIVVSRKPFEGEADAGDMWDSGKMDSDESIQIEYAGKPLESDTDYYWRVCVWDKAGNSSGWSPSAKWSTGLLHDEDWKARWISMPDECDPPEDGALSSKDLSSAFWITLPPSVRTDKETDVYAGEMTYFRRVFELPEDVRVKRALLCGTGDCRPISFINRKRVATGYHYGYPHWVDVTEAVRGGRNMLAYMLNNSAGYDTGVNFAALAACLTIWTEDGRTLCVSTDDRWECARAKAPDWLDGPGDDEAWMTAAAEAAFGEGPWTGPFVLPPKPFHPSQNDVFYARKTWTISSPVRRAVLYATALGVYRAYVNGEPAGDQVLAPGWTDYHQRVMVQAYDVTNLLQTGDNAVGLVVTPGWYAGCVAMFGPYQYGTKPYALVQLHVECEDGSTIKLISDSDWSVSRGPIRFADLLMGEIYDARRELSGWAEPGTPSQGVWASAESRERGELGGRLVPHSGPPVRVVTELSAQAVSEPAPGVFVIDFGQNAVGWVRMRVSGPAGAEVRLRHAEMLNADGTVYVTNLRSAKATDHYILKGEGIEVFEPDMTFHGFRYLEVTGYPGRPEADRFTACVVASDTPETGRFETSDPLLNKLYSNIVWGQRDNFLSVPTDCPQRDERLGWSGDAQIFVRTASYNMDTASFFAKWMQDVAEAQRESGAVTNVAPHLGWLDSGIGAWGDAVIIVPWTIWRMYGDRRILEDCFVPMCRHMDYLRSTSPDWIRPAKGFGDWLSIGADTPKDLLGTAYFGYCAKLLAEIADILGKKREAERYREWFAAIRETFVRAYVREDGTVLGDTQTGYVLALHMDLLPAELREAAARHLAADIRAKGDRLSTGFIGVSYLLPILCDAGYPELAYRLLQQREFPSWLYSVLQGATTVWERWNGWTKEHGFYSAVMNSFNHYSLGSVGEWMFRYMAGIEPDEPGFKRFQLRPVPGGSLAFVRAEFDSMYGTVKASWSIDGNRIIYDATVPPNTEATVLLPVGSAGNRGPGGVISEPPVWSDPELALPAGSQPGVTYLGTDSGVVRYRAIPGTYRFVWMSNGLPL